MHKCLLPCLRVLWRWAGWQTVPAVASEYVPPYGDFELQARGNLDDGFNLPPNSFFTDSTPDISGTGFVAVHLTDVGGSSNHGVWLGGNGVGLVAHELTGGEGMGDVSVNDAGYVAWQQFSGGEGIWLYDPAVGTVSRIVSPGGPFSLTGFGARR